MEENQKTSRIIEQFSLFLLENHISNFSVSVRKTRKLISLIFTCEAVNEEIIAVLHDTFKDERKEEFELYGWELLGQGTLDHELSLVSMLIDYFTYYIQDGRVLFNLVRYEED